MSDFPYFIIEHNETDFPAGGWCVIEYTNILRVVGAPRVIITNMPTKHQSVLPEEFKDCAAITDKSLLDYLEGGAAHTLESTPEVLRAIGRSAVAVGETGETRVCFLDEQGNGPFRPSDIKAFDYVILGGILGDHPPKDVGGYLRNYNFAVRHLGPRQMSTDTAALACATVLRHQVPIDALLYMDDPEVFADEIDQVPKDKSQVKGYRESTAIRMRYLAHQQPVLEKPEHQAIPLISSLSDNTGHWDKAKPEEQQHLKTAPVNTPRITPGLLKHIFESADNGLFDFDGALDVLDEELDEEEKQALNATLFDF